MNRISYLFFLSALSVDGHFSDKCDYISYGYKCGEECLNSRTFFCVCGDVPLSSSQYCCVENQENGTLCSYDYRNEAIDLYQVLCSSGIPTVLDKSQRCNGQCYNDYNSSEKLGPDAHLACADGQCMSVKDMCQGVQCTEKAEECSEEHPYL